MSATPRTGTAPGWRSDRRGAALAGAALALAASLPGPRIELERPRFEHVVVLDVTQSMNVADETLDGRRVSRLVAAKQALRHAVEALPCGSRIGWAIFTEHRAYLLFTPVEVCAHRAELRSSLAAIDGRMAWSGNSEVAKGLHSGIGIARQLPGVPSLVFVSDGHEAPPLSPRHRPRYDDKPGEVAGVVVGVGALVPSPIPKSDALGRPLGWWGADDVPQTDPRSEERDSAGDERPADAADTAAAAMGALPGGEHRSSLREAHLRLLAAENGLAYHRLRSAEALAAALRAPALVRPVRAPLDLRPALAALALGLVLAAWWPAGRRRR